MINPPPPHVAACSTWKYIFVGRVKTFSRNGQTHESNWERSSSSQTAQLADRTPKSFTLQRVKNFFSKYCCLATLCLMENVYIMPSLLNTPQLVAPHERGRKITYFRKCHSLNNLLLHCTFFCRNDVFSLS